VGTGAEDVGEVAGEVGEVGADEVAAGEGDNQCDAKPVN